MTGATKNPTEQKDVAKDKESNEKSAEAKKPEKSNKDDKKEQVRIFFVFKKDWNSFPLEKFLKIKLKLFRE